MLFSIIILLPLAQLALAHPHLAPRRHHARAAAAAAAAEVTDRPLVERAGAAIGNDTRDEISAWRHSQEVVTASSSAVISSANGVQGVGTALTAVNSDSAIASPTSAVETSAQASLPEQEASPSVVLESVVETVTSEAAQPSSTEPAAAASPSSSPAAESSVEVSSSSEPSSRSSVTHTTVVTASRSSTVVRVTASSSASASAAASKDEPETIAGLNKTTFIIIIVVASVVALLAAGWTVFRKWKLRPSRRFDEKMRPIDFSPDNGTGDVFMEKTHARSSSYSSAAMHRQELVAELDSKHVEGVPDHDFTAPGGHGNMAGAGAYDNDIYNQDPYSHAEAYEYDAAYQYDEDPRAYPHVQGLGLAHDQPTQDTGYADLHRGNSIGSGSGHGHGHGQQYPVESFPMPDHYLNRPISSDAPYGTSHRY